MEKSRQEMHEMGLELPHHQARGRQTQGWEPEQGEPPGARACAV